MKYEKRVNEYEIPFGMFQPGKRTYLFRFSTFSGNFPVERTGQTFYIYCRTEIFGNFEKKGERPVRICGYGAEVEVVEAVVVMCLNSLMVAMVAVQMTHSRNDVIKIEQTLYNTDASTQ